MFRNDCDLFIWVDSGGVMNYPFIRDTEELILNLLINLFMNFITIKHVPKTISAKIHESLHQQLRELELIKIRNNKGQIQ